MSLPTLTLASLRTDARSKSGVNSTDYSNSKLDSDLNRAYVKLAYYLAHIEEDFFEEQNTLFDLVARSSLYAQPADCIAIKQLRLAYSTPSTEADYVIAEKYGPEDVHDVGIDEINVPIANPIFDITGNYFRLRPKPTTDVTGGGRLFYIAMPSALANTGDIPNLPIAYHEKLSDYAAMQMTFKYEKWKKYKELKNNWDGTIAELSQILAERNRDGVTQFKTPHQAMMGGTRIREL